MILMMMKMIGSTITMIQINERFLLFNIIIICLDMYTIIIATFYFEIMTWLPQTINITYPQYYLLIILSTKN
jgi:hypothetical protein